MLTCPHCGARIDLRRIKHEGLFVSYRVCPTCEQAFDVDPRTKRRQAAFVILALASLALTVMMYADVRTWLPYAIVSYLLAGAVIYYGNKRVFFVKSDGAPGKSNQPSTK